MMIRSQIALRVAGLANCSRCCGMRATVVSSWIDELTSCDATATRADGAGGGWHERPGVKAVPRARSVRLQPRTTSFLVPSEVCTSNCQMVSIKLPSMGKSLWYRLA